MLQMVDCALEPLRVISKTEWLHLKEDFKQLKHSLLQKRPPVIDKTILSKGTLLTLSPVPPTILKEDIKIALLHFCEPSYVDLPPASQKAIIRLPSVEEKNRLMQSAKNTNGIVVKGCTLAVGSLSEMEETEYFKKIEQKRQRLKQDKENRKADEDKNTKTPKGDAVAGKKGSHKLTSVFSPKAKDQKNKLTLKKTASMRSTH